MSRGNSRKGGGAQPSPPARCAAARSAAAAPARPRQRRPALPLCAARAGRAGVGGGTFQSSGATGPSPSSKVPGGSAAGGYGCSSSCGYRAAWSIHRTLNRAWCSMSCPAPRRARASGATARAARLRLSGGRTRGPPIASCSSVSSRSACANGSNVSAGVTRHAAPSPLGAHLLGRLVLAAGVALEPAQRGGGACARRLCRPACGAVAPPLEHLHACNSSQHTRSTACTPGAARARTGGGGREARGAQGWGPSGGGGFCSSA